VKRHLAGAAAALVVIASGALASACNVAAPAATANGTTISTSSLNSQLSTLANTVSGGCLLQLQDAEIDPSEAQGAGGSGTYTMEFVNAVLNDQVSELLGEQYAASKGLTVSSSDLASAKSDLESTLDGEINQAAEQSESDGTVSLCQDASGSAITGAALLNGLPDAVRSAQVTSQAVDEKLLADGADLSPQAIFGYYAANTAQFTGACVSVIVAATDAEATSVVSQLNAGASFAQLAKSNSTDTQTAADGGSLGCDYTLAEVEQSLSVQSITVGKPLAPLQDSQSGQWEVYEVTSQQVEPLSAATSVVKRELLQTTANVNRVSKEIQAFARRSSVSVDPQYGKWRGLTIVSPVGPPSRFLLAAVSGYPGSSTSLNVNSGTTSGTGSAGSSSSTGGS
jgi:parvulin-like peptidyl-prolyl isomerase